MTHFIMAFLLLGPGAEVAGPPPPPPADPVICKRYEETGSLIKKRKVCRTKSEWAKAASEMQETLNRFVEDRRTRPAGN